MGNDWVVISLAKPGEIESVEIDTAHFKGNFPDSFNLQAANLGHTGSIPQAEIDSIDWRELLERKKLKADEIHKFSDVQDLGKITHVLLNIYPDGGVSRLRLYGRVFE